MQHIPEHLTASAASAASAAASAKPSSPQASAEAAAAWLREFRSWTAGTASGSKNASAAGAAGTSAGDVASVLEGLAGAFPGATITSASLGSFGSVKDHYAASGAGTSVNLDAATLERMGADAAFSRSVEQALSSLLSAGSGQNLVAAGGSSSATSRHVSVADGVVRYTEVQRTASGTQMAVTSLSLEAAGTGGEENLDAVLAELAGAGAGTGGGAGTGASSFDFLFQSASAYSTSSVNWRLESFLSPSAARNIMTAQQSFQTRELTLQVTGRQWPAGRASGTVDLQSYMELMGLTDPLVLDLAGDGINLKSAEDGVYFDIHADGRPVRTAFIQGDDAFLYLDENGNGTADSGAELFGDHGGFAGGFDKLARHDSNRDGVIDVHDAVYDKLRLWQDRNGDGVNQEDESLSLADAGVAAINLRHGGGGMLDRHGNVIADEGRFTRADGRAGRVADAWLRSLG